MKKTNYKTINLGKGEMNVYDVGSVRLHAYKTNDFLADEVFIFEKNGEAVVLELPCFTDNISELAEYVEGMGVEVVGKLVAYHMAGATFLPGVPVYATANAEEYSHSGGGKGLIDNFTGTFGEIFDPSIVTVTNTIKSGTVTLAGIQFNIIQTPDAFDVEIPEINAVYTHMLGSDCHSIVAGSGHADAIIEQLNGYLTKGYNLVLSSHYTPEDLKDVEIKIAYLQDLKRIATASGNAAAFKATVKDKYPAYSGENYLDMSASFFFPAQ